MRWWRGYDCMRDVRYVSYLPVVRYGSEDQVSVFKINIDWHVSCASFSPTPTAYTLWRSLLTMILQTVIYTTAVSLRWFKCTSHFIACSCEIRGPSAATITLQPMEASMCTRVNMDMTVAFSMCSKTRSSPWFWVVVGKNTLHFGFEAFGTCVKHSEHLEQQPKKLYKKNALNIYIYIYIYFFFMVLRAGGEEVV